jgi:hypothetical protein
MTRHARRMRLIVSILAVSWLWASAAFARHGGIYLELAPSYGFLLQNQAVIEKGDDNYGEKLEATFVPQVKLGVNLFGWAGVEGQFAGHFWDVGGDPGGAGYLGGVARVTPLEVLSYILPDTVQLPSILPHGPVTWKDRPFDLGVSVGAGYTIAGEDYAYQGWYLQYGVDVKWYITPFFSVGLDFPFRSANYQPFRYSDYNGKTGFCTDGSDAYGRGGIPIPDTAGTSLPGLEFNASDIDAECTEPAPAVLLFAPAFTIGGVFDFGI